jgi:hypothetical protein
MVSVSSITLQPARPSPLLSLLIMPKSRAKSASTHPNQGRNPPSAPMLPSSRGLWASRRCPPSSSRQHSNAATSTHLGACRRLDVAVRAGARPCEAPPLPAFVTASRRRRCRCLARLLRTRMYTDPPPHPPSIHASVEEGEVPMGGCCQFRGGALFLVVSDGATTRYCSSSFIRRRIWAPQPDDTFSLRGRASAAFSIVSDLLYPLCFCWARGDGCVTGELLVVAATQFMLLQMVASIHSTIVVAVDSYVLVW